MIQFNLLPDVKLEFIKSQRLKRMIVTYSVLASLVSLGILLSVVVLVHVFQKSRIRSLTADIKRDSARLQGTENINKILTVQSQLKSLPALHNKKPVATRIFRFVEQLTPVEASISNYELDYAAQSITISGEANNLVTINKFIDTIKFTEYKTANGQQSKAFNTVVLSNFARLEKATSYTVTLKFDPLIYSNDNDVTLIVPNTITTRSTLEKPSEDLFKTQTSPNKQQGGR